MRLGILHCASREVVCRLSSVLICPFSYGPRSKRTEAQDVLKFKKKSSMLTFDSDARRQSV